MSNAVLQEPVMGWIINHAKKNYWRMSSWYELDDLIQDGIVCGYKCLQVYGIPPYEIDDQHFMKLVQTTFYNYIAELLRRKRAVDDITIRYEDNPLLQLFDSHSSVIDIELNLLINKLPKRLKRVIDLYLRNPNEIRRPLRIKLKGKETMSDRLNRLADYPTELDFETDLRSVLSKL